MDFGAMNSSPTDSELDRRGFSAWSQQFAAMHRGRVVLYSHDTMGIGHMRRNILIAQTLAGPPTSAAVLLIAGAREASNFTLAPNVDCLTLPALRKVDNGHYASRKLRMSLGELIRLRAETIAAAVRAFRPDVLIADKEPRGALGELQPTLDWLRSEGRARCVLGLRDVLDDPATVRREWAESGNEQTLQQYYHAVWVYGDPAVYDLAREYGFSAEVRAKLTYAGYLDACQRLGEATPGDDGGPAQRPVSSRRYALCMVGGGQDGAQLAETFAAAAFPTGLSGVVLTGPYMPADSRAAIRSRAEGNPNLRVLDFVAEPCRLIRRAERVVTMGGYNTVSEILAFEKAALVIPRITPRREQLIRAQRLSELALFDMLHPDQLSPTAVGNWLAREPGPMPRARRVIDLNGTRRLPGLLRSVLSIAGCGQSRPASRSSREVSNDAD
jgi:predicted glycosyltransferase